MPCAPVPHPLQRCSARVSPVCQSRSYWVNTAGYKSEAHGWSMLNLLSTRTLFCAELLLASLSAACSTAQAWTFHQPSLKFTQFPSAHSCQPAALPSSLLTAPLSGTTQELRRVHSIPSTTVSQFPASTLRCNLGYCT